MKRHLLSFLLLLPAILFAQDFKLGKVSIEELNEKQHPLNPSAPAAILYKTGTTSFDFNKEGRWITVTDVKVRLKVYNKEGFAHASAEVPFISGGTNKEEVIFSDAASYTITGNKIEKNTTATESETESADKRYRVKKLTFPNISEGSVVEYSYQLKSPVITQFPDWYFQYDIPVNKIEYNVHIPQYFVYNRLLSPYIPVTEKTGSNREVKRFSNPAPKGVQGSVNPTLVDANGKVAFTESIKTYTAQNVPALKSQAYVDNIDNYRSFVKHELVSTQYPGTPKKDYSVNWYNLSKQMYKDDFAPELKGTAYFEQDLLPVLKAASGRDEIITAVFDFVKNRMIWDGETNYKCKKGLQQAYADGSGNVADINLMLVAMLRYAGINASPVLLSTRDNGHVLFVSRDEFNYLITGIEVQNGIIFLDATSKNAVPGILPVRALNGTGRIIRDNGTTEEVSLIPSALSKENTIVMAKMAADGTVTGQAKIQYFDYNAFAQRENSSLKGKKAWESNGVALTGHAVANLTDLSKPVTEDFSFKSSSFGEAKGGKLYLSPMLFFTLHENPFKDEARAYPVDIMYPKQNRYTISIDLPDGYVVESLPEPVHLSMGELGSFKYNIAAGNAGQVQAVITTDINRARMSPDDYTALKDFYEGMVKKQNEKIVLKKA